MKRRGLLTAGIISICFMLSACGEKSENLDTQTIDMKIEKSLQDENSKVDTATQTAIEKEAKKKLQSRFQHMKFPLINCIG